MTPGSIPPGTMSPTMPEGSQRSPATSPAQYLAVHLLPQLHGFEGGSPVGMIKDAHDLAIPKSPLRVKPEIGRDPADLSPGRYVDQRQHVLAILDHFLELKTVRVA